MKVQCRTTLMDKLSLRVKALLKLLSIMVFAVILNACASSGNTAIEPASSGNISRISQCKTSDKQISSSRQCLQDDAACYQISNGQWCTGPRGNSCPAGSTALSNGAACPTGKRCFSVGESLQCTIS